MVISDWSLITRIIPPRRPVSYLNYHHFYLYLVLALSMLVTACGGGGGGGGGCRVATVTVSRISSPPDYIGDQIQFNAVAATATGAPCAVQFDWTAAPSDPSDAGVVTVTSSGLATLKFISTATYDAVFTITAAVHNGSVSGTMGLTVQNPVASVTVTPDPATALTVCGAPSQEQFIAAISYQTRPPNFMLPTISWSSSNASVATISSTGLATAVDSTNSPATISAAADAVVSAGVTLAVGGSPSLTVAVSPNPDAIPAGATHSYSAAVTGFVSDGSVSWNVDGGGSNGTIASTGPNNADYTAPAGVPASNPVTIRAISNENTNCSGTALVTILPTFGAATEYGLGGGRNPQALVIGQLNATTDGDPLLPLDVAVANQDTNTVSILTGDNTGILTLMSTAAIGSGSNPVSIAKGLFDNDTLVDLATANPGADDAAILLANGDGTFASASPATAVTNQTPLSVTAGDFNGDGYDDLATANYHGNGTNGNVTILLSNGDGTFTEALFSPVSLLGSGPWAVAAGYVDGDANLDLVVTDVPGDTVWIILGNGDGTFQTTGISPVAVPFPPGAGPAAVVIGDFDGDGFADLAVVNQGSAGESCSAPIGSHDSVTILFGLGDGTFNPFGSLIKPPVTYAVGSNPRAIAIGDFNNDGFQDLVTANYCSDDVSVLLGIGDGTFQPAVSFSTGMPSQDRPTGVAAGDLDNTGFDDLVVTDSGTDSVSVLLNNN